MKPSELKYHVEQGSDSHFFERRTMKFFGDTMANYGCRQATVKTRDGLVDAWELYRKRPVKHGLKSSAYFAADDYRRVFEETILEREV